MYPLFSIITATYNSERTLEATIESVLNQDFNNFEYIIIDGKSTDRTIKIVEKYEQIFIEKGICYKWISEKDTGIYNAWNKGLQIASGRWIAFLGSDDIYLRESLKKYSKAAWNNPEVDFIHSKVRIFRDSLFIRDIDKKWCWNAFKKSMNIAHAGAFHNRFYFKTHGNFNESYKVAGDYEMLLRAKNKLNIVFIDDFTVIMKEGGLSSKRFLLSFNEADRAKKNTAGIKQINVICYSIYNLYRYFGGKILRKLGLK